MSFSAGRKREVAIRDLASDVQAVTETLLSHFTAARRLNEGGLNGKKLV